MIQSHESCRWTTSQRAVMIKDSPPVFKGPSKKAMNVIPWAARHEENVGPPHAGPSFDRGFALLFRPQRQGLGGSLALPDPRQHLAFPPRPAPLAPPSDDPRPALEVPPHPREERRPLLQPVRRQRRRIHRLVPSSGAHRGVGQAAVCRPQGGDPGGLLPGDVPRRAGLRHLHHVRPPRRVPSRQAALCIETAAPAGDLLQTLSLGDRGIERRSAAACRLPSLLFLPGKSAGLHRPPSSLSRPK